MEFCWRPVCNAEEGKLLILLNPKAVPPGGQASQAELQNRLDRALPAFDHRGHHGHEDYVTCPSKVWQPVRGKGGLEPRLSVSFFPSPPGHVDSPWNNVTSRRSTRSLQSDCWGLSPGPWTLFATIQSSKTWEAVLVCKENGICNAPSSVPGKCLW